MTKNKRSQKKNKHFNTILTCYQQIMFEIMMSKGHATHNSVGEGLCALPHNKNKSSPEGELFHTIAYVL